MKHLALLLLAALPAALPAAALAGQFPALQSETLNQKQVSLPQDFGGRRSILLIAYKMNQQAVVDSWGEFVATAKSKHPGVQAYELPVLGGNMGFMRGFIDGGMRNGIADSATRDHTITLYTDVGPLQAALGISGTSTIHAVVIDRSGKVLAAVAGPYSKASAEKIEAALN
ncbi:MAG TPA: hypothetical protein VFE64_08310 [Devosia sp.]|jgi:hypothetical protein|nr:hypothetical protein [Devosia sp.]